MKASVITLGCKVNEYESQSILNQLKSAGCEIAEGLVKADVYVLNSCAVTNTAEQKSRQTLTKILKLNPDAKIIVCGCAAQNNPAQFLKNKNVFAILGNAGKHEIMKFINKPNKTLPDLIHNKYTNTARPIETRTRQFIKIQDGCDYFCTYCLIPYVRGRSRSRDLADIIDEITNTQAQEIVLTGINMSDYKIDGALALKTLVEAVDKCGKRFRLSSLECNVLNDEMLKTLKQCKNFCPHFHLSLQSACNATLKRMNRRYTIEQFIKTTQKIRKIFKNASISTDIIVGFVGETEEEFKQTFENLKKINFSFMHIFPYSERAGTVALKLNAPKVDKTTKKQRENKLIELNNQFKNAFYSQNKGTIHKVLVELVDQNFSFGYTDNYIYTYIPQKLELGKIYDIKLTKPYLEGMQGVVHK